MTLLHNRVMKAFAEVGSAFPIPDYCQDYSRIQIEEIAASLQRIVGDFKGKRLLDVGSGPMDKAAVFSRLGFDCFAADDLSDPWHLTPGMRDAILDFGKKFDIAFHRQTPEDYSIPFENESFDVVTSIAVIEHLHDSPRQILNAMGEKLKPGGTLVVVMPNSVNLRKRISVLRGRTNYNPLEELYFSIGGYRGHVREYTLDETVQICKWSGFDLVEARTFEHLAQSKLGAVGSRIYAALGNLLPGLRSGLLVICRKPTDWTPAKEDSERYFEAIGGALPTAIGSDGMIRSLAGYNAD